MRVFGSIIIRHLKDRATSAASGYAYGHLNVAREFLDFEPRVSLDEGVKKTVDFYRTQSLRKEQQQ